MHCAALPGGVARRATGTASQLGDGYAMPRHGGYHAIPPRDQLHNLRSRVCRHLDEMGVPVKYHHHEVGGPGQCEIETPLLPLLKAADAAMLVKYVARMTALEDGLTATFMPKPLFGEAGSGMHFHQRLERGGENLFYDADGLRPACREPRSSYVAGLLLHGGAVLAFTNPSDQLLPPAGTRASRRRSARSSQPATARPRSGSRSTPTPPTAPGSSSGRRTPPPTPTSRSPRSSSPGSTASARGLDPTELGFGPIDEDIFSWPPERRATIKALPTSLDQALDLLEADHEFLLEGGVFSRELIDRWITRKREEERAVRLRPHPYEVELYYDL